MREHGALRRVLLIYDEIGRRLSADTEPPAGVLTTAADIIRRFVEEYHEKLEETELFPRFEKAGKMVDLVKALVAPAPGRQKDHRGSSIFGDARGPGRCRLSTSAAGLPAPVHPHVLGRTRCARIPCSFLPSLPSCPGRSIRSWGKNLKTSNRNSSA